MKDILTDMKSLLKDLIGYLVLGDSLMLIKDHGEWLLDININKKNVTIYNLVTYQGQSLDALVKETELAINKLIAKKKGR